MASGEPDLAKLSSDYQSLINHLPMRSKLMASGTRKPASDPFELSTANSLWVDKSYPLSRDFSRIVGQSFGASSANSCDFQKSADAERVRINDWVATQTYGKIRDIIPVGSLSPETRLVIANAIYFKGNWAKPFEASRTANAEFTDENKKKTQVSMMFAPALKEAWYAAFESDGTAFETPAMANAAPGQDKLYPGNDGYQVVELPYAGEQLSMLIVLPRTVDGLNKLVASMTADQFETIRQQLKSRPVHVKLPKFKLESNYDLIPDLKALGMQAAFSPDAADFSGLTDSLSPEHRLYISLVIHKAYVDVNEQGTEAAAATIVGMARAAAPAARPFIPEFTADRPFLFSIIDRQTNNILFIGKVNSCASPVLGAHHEPDKKLSDIKFSFTQFWVSFFRSPQRAVGKLCCNSWAA